MLTMDKVFEIFEDYLAVDKSIEFVTTSRGLMRIVWYGEGPESCDCRLCWTPQELFDDLISLCETYEEIELTKGRREPTPEDVKQVQARVEVYRKKKILEELQ